MDIRAGLKKMFPKVFELYKHCRRVNTIHHIAKIKKLSIDEIANIVSERYLEKIGHPLNWESLNTYTEKMQWEKLYDNNPLKTEYADKLLVRNWIAKTIGQKYLIPLLGYWDSFDDIDFGMLPNRFVLKTNHGSGTNIIVKDKSLLDKKTAKMKFDDWMKIDFGYLSMELHYSNIKRRIIAEKYIESENGELEDYKFLCFDGVPYYCWVDMGRYSHHTRNVYDLNWNLQPWNQETYSHYDKPIPKPDNFEEMVSIAKILSKGFFHVRVDFYNVRGKTYFGEMTFSNGGAFDRIIPEEYDSMLGDLLHIKQ